VPSQTVILVGGFAESPFLRSELEKRFKPQNVTLFKIDEPTYVDLPSNTSSR